MPGKREEPETVNLEGLGENKDGANRNSGRRRQDITRNKRVIIIGVLVTVCIVILIIVGAWFIYTNGSDSHPEWLQTIPGLHYRPESSVRGSLIMFRTTDEDSYKPWVKVIDRFLEKYRFFQRSSNMMTCDYNNFPSSGKVCEVDLRKIYPCVAENYYSYNRGSPCIFLKIHKFPNWVPEYYNKTDLPEAMPGFLKNYIQSQPIEQLQTLWMSCDGETDTDKELIGPVTYYPYRGFPGYYFPYRDIEDFLSPLVAIHLERPRAGIVINIECKLWAKNIAHDREKGIGLVHFEVMID